MQTLKSNLAPKLQVLWRQALAICGQIVYLEPNLRADLALVEQLPYTRGEVKQFFKRDCFYAWPATQNLQIWRQEQVRQALEFLEVAKKNLPEMATEITALANCLFAESSSQKENSQAGAAILAITSIKDSFEDVSPASDADNFGAFKTIDQSNFFDILAAEKIEAVSIKPALNVKNKVAYLFVPPIETSLKVKIQPEPMQLDIRYEDADLLVINKPKGLVVHPAPGNWQGTLVHALSHYLSQESLWQPQTGVVDQRMGIVHRIDKDTSGLLVVAKHKVALQALQALLQEHKIKRYYRALAWGWFLEPEFTIKGALGRDLKNPLKRALVATGKLAITHGKVLEQFANVADLSLHLETGRTHQIRVHLQAIKHPILGDPLYGDFTQPTFGLKGQCLHAERLTFEHPFTKQLVDVMAPLPSYYQDLLNQAKKQGKL